MVTNSKASAHAARVDPEAQPQPPTQRPHRVNGTLVAALFVTVIVILAAVNYAFRQSNGHDVHFNGARGAHVVDAA